MVYFDDNIVGNILKRLPAKQIAQCKVICKQWGNLLKHTHFNEIHTQHASDYHILVSIGDLVNIDYTRGVLVPIAQPLESDLHSIIDLQCSCNGLVCLSVSKFPNYESRILVLNPTSSQFREITHPVEHDTTTLKLAMDEFDRVSYGLFYNVKLHTFELLHLRRSDDRYETLVHRFTLARNAWNLPETIPYSVDRCNPAVSTRTGVYWTTFHPQGQILCFEIEKALFKTICKPKTAKMEGFMSLGAVRGELFLLNSLKNELVEGYKMEEQGGMWVKLFVIVHPIVTGANDLLPVLVKEDELLLDKDAIALIRISPEDVSEVVVYDDERHLGIVAYTETVTSLNVSSSCDD